MGASERFQSETKEEPPSINLNSFPSMDGIDYLDLTLHDIPHRQSSLTQQTENILNQSAFGVNVDQREAHSQPHERPRNDNSVHYSNHKPINAELVNLVNREALFMHNIEYTSDQMDIDIKVVPDPLDLQPIPILSSNDPFLHLPRPIPDEGISGNVTINISPPRLTTRPRSRLERLARIENGSESEESEESSSEESTSSTEDYPIPVHPISGRGDGPCRLKILLLTSPVLLRVAKALLPTLAVMQPDVRHLLRNLRQRLRRCVPQTQFLVTPL